MERRARRRVPFHPRLLVIWVRGKRRVAVRTAARMERRVLMLGREGQFGSFWSFWVASRAIMPLRADTASRRLASSRIQPFLGTETVSSPPFVSREVVVGGSK